MVSRGARMVEYWHWHSLHYGAETFWGGILGHGLRPGRVYDEIAQIGAEFAQAGESVAELRPDVDVAIVWSTESDWALQFQPPLAHPGGAPDKSSYRTIVTAFYTGVLDAGLRPGSYPSNVLATIRSSWWRGSPCWWCLRCTSRPTSCWSCWSAMRRRAVTW